MFTDLDHAASSPRGGFPRFGAAVQLGHLVRDIHGAMRIWTDTFRVGPFVLVEDVRLAEASYRGVPTDIRLSVALSYLGDLQIELIQQLNESPSPYQDFLADGREGLHHLAFWPEDFDGVCRDLAESGLGPVYAVRPDGQAKPTLYFSDPGGLGNMVEIIEATPGKRQVYAAISALARTWNGSAPVRRVANFADILGATE
jgi:hypothetical protein